MLRGSSGELNGFNIEGHALYAPHGSDIVCSAVSVLAQTAVLAIDKLIDSALDVKVEEGKLECRLMNERNTRKKEDRALILDAMVLGLQETAGSYPGYLEIEEKI